MVFLLLMFVVVWCGRDCCGIWCWRRRGRGVEWWCAVLDGVGAIILGDIGQAVVVVLHVVVAILWTALVRSAISFEICVVALSSFAAVGCRLCGVLAPSAVRIRGGTRPRRKWQRRRRVLQPIACETQMREQASHHQLVHVAKPALGHLPTHQPHLALVSASISFP